MEKFVMKSERDKTVRLATGSVRDALVSDKLEVVCTHRWSRYAWRVDAKQQRDKGSQRKAGKEKERGLGKQNLMDKTSLFHCYCCVSLSTEPLSLMVQAKACVWNTLFTRLLLSAESPLQPWVLLALHPLGP